MEALNSIQLANQPIRGVTQFSLLPPSSSSSRDRISWFHALKHHQQTCNLRVSVNSSVLSTCKKTIKMGAVFSDRGSAQSAGTEASPAGKNPFKSWRNWVVGVLISVVLPFAHNRWARFLAIKNEVETAVKTVKTAVEVVEKAAEEVAEVADEVADHLPQDSTFKSAVETVEHFAKETAKDAHIADDFIEKVEEVEMDVESVFEGKTDEKNLEETQENGVSMDDNKQHETKKMESVSTSQVQEIAMEVTHQDDQVIKDVNQAS